MKGEKTMRLKKVLAIAFASLLVLSMGIAAFAAVPPKRCPPHQWTEVGGALQCDWCGTIWWPKSIN